MSILAFIASIFKPAVDLIDDLHLSKEEKMKLENEMAKIQVGVKEKMIELEKAKIDGQASIITAEAGSDSWLTRSWRPIVVTGLFLLVVLEHFGINGAKDLPPDAWDVIKIGIGGYIGSRGVEKTADKIMGHKQLLKAYKDLVKEKIENKD